MATFLYQRGKGVKRRVTHLATFGRDGSIDGTWCRQTAVRLDTSCNLPLGLRVCKKCRKAMEQSQ